MVSVSKLPSRHAIKEEAAEWLIKLDGDEPPSAQELDALREWLGRSPVHSQVLNSMNTFWGNNVLTELVVPLGKHEPKVSFFDRLMSKMGGFEGASAIAVSCSIIVAIVMLSPAPLTESNGLYSTAVGQQKELTLADGSHIQLNTNSQVEVRYDEQYRNIQLLQGEVHFDVAKDSTRPFRVYAGARRVQAVGTAFSVHIKEKDVNILVTEGRVALASLGALPPLTTKHSESLEPVEQGGLDRYTHSESKALGTLSEGESVTINIAEAADVVAKSGLDADVEQVSQDELSRRQSWRDGLLVFSGEPLDEVIYEISRYTTVSIEIADPALRDIQIGGRFKVGDIDHLFKALEANFGIEVDRLSYTQARLTLSARSSAH